MMKWLRRVLLLFFAVVWALQQPAAATAAETEIPQEILAYLQTEMEQIKEDFGTECLWTADTRISRFYVIKRANGDPYLLLVELEGNGEPQGYVEILYDRSSLSGFAFRERSSLTAMLERHQLDPDEHSGYEGKLYFAGSISYAVENPDGKFTYLSSGKTVSRAKYAQDEAAYFGTTPVLPPEEGPSRFIWILGGAALLLGAGGVMVWRRKA